MIEILLSLLVSFFILFSIGALAMSIYWTIDDYVEWRHTRKWRHQWLSNNKKKKVWRPKYWATYSPVYNRISFVNTKARNKLDRFISPLKELTKINRIVSSIIRSFNVGDDYIIIDSECPPKFSPLSMLTQVDCGRCGNQSLGIWLKTNEDEEGRPKSNIYYRGICLRCARKMKPEDRDRFSIVWMASRPPDVILKDSGTQREAPRPPDFGPIFDGDEYNAGYDDEDEY